MFFYLKLLFENKHCFVSKGMLRKGATHEAGTVNAFGDKQLVADVKADEIIFTALRQSGAVSVASSEEQTDMLSMGGEGFSVRRGVKQFAYLKDLIAYWHEGSQQDTGIQTVLPARYVCPQVAPNSCQWQWYEGGL
jgi:Fructose-1-6-bisphosphatase, N-terminal domain